MEGPDHMAVQRVYHAAEVFGYAIYISDILKNMKLEINNIYIYTFSIYI